MKTPVTDRRGMLKRLALGLAIAAVAAPMAHAQDWRDAGVATAIAVAIAVLAAAALRIGRRRNLAGP